MTTVADVVADGLARSGTARVFALAADHDTRALIEALERRYLSVVTVAGPAVACAMAGVTGVLTGAPGAALIGRDLDGAAAGLGFAWRGRQPLIAITSGVAVDAGGADTPAKAALAVTAGSAAHWIAHACQLAMKEPWGPVRLDLPPAVAGSAALPLATSCRPAPLAAPSAEALEAAVRLLAASERPVVVVGTLCRSEADAVWIRAFAEARPAPVLVTRAARGVLPDPHPLVIGVLDGGAAERGEAAARGGTAARTLLASADLVIAVGVDPAETGAASWPATTPVLHLTPAVGDAPAPGAQSVAGDIGLVLEEMAPRLRDCRLAEWDVARLHALKQAAAAPPVEPRRRAAHRIVEAARRLTPAGTTAVFEDGDAWSEAARAWQAVAPGECLIVGEFALAAAIAAQLARPGRRVVCFTSAAAMDAAADQLRDASALGLRPLIVVAADAAPAVAFTRSFEAALIAAAPAPVRIGLTVDID